MASRKVSITTSVIPGSRTLAREKLLQVFFAAEISRTDPRQLFPYVFPFNFRMETPTPSSGRPLRPEEIEALDSDIRIQWSDAELQFARRFVEEYVQRSDQVVKLIEQFAENWTYERLTPVDRVILKMGITEFLAFPDIPMEVTINEAVELAKKFSTAKSTSFVNGVLDAILHHLAPERLLHKDHHRKA